MKKHIELLLLLDYAQGRISDEDELDQITDHLCECEFCQQVLKSHYYLIHNHEIFLKRFSFETDSELQVKTFKTVKQKGFQISPTLIIQTISDKIRALRERGIWISQEIKEEISGLMEEIRLQPHIKELTVPIKVEHVRLLDASETKKPKGQELRYLSHNIRLLLLPVQGFRMEDFNFQFTGKFLYVIYEADNYKELIDRKITLSTDIGFPYIFNADFKEAHKNVIAKFRIEFEEPLISDTSIAGKEVDHDFFINIE